MTLGEKVQLALFLVQAFGTIVLIVYAWQTKRMADETKMLAEDSVRRSVRIDKKIRAFSYIVSCANRAAYWVSQDEIEKETRIGGDELSSILHELLIEGRIEKDKMKNEWSALKALTMPKQP